MRHDDTPSPAPSAHMYERSPSRAAIKRMVEWLEYCKEMGWPKESMPRLCDIWWEYHDDEGNLIAQRRAGDQVAIKLPERV